MKARLRTFFAVIAVALMLACAFAPLVSNGNSVSAESSVTEIENVKTEDASAESILTDMLTSLITGDDSEDMSEKLGQLLVSLFSGAASGDDGSVDYTSELSTSSEITKANSMAGLGSAAKKYDVWNDAIFIPVENTITDYSDLPALTASGVDEGIKAARLYNMTIDKESTTDKLDFSVPYVTIKKGETLVIFPTDASIGDYSFSIKYSTTDGPSYGHICLESGAILNLFGMSFMVIFDDDNGSRLNSLFRIENGQTMTLSRTYDGKTFNYTDSIKTSDSKKHIGIADFFNDRNLSIDTFDLRYKLTKDWDLNDDKCLNALFEYVILQINAITQSSGSDVMIESIVYLKKVDLTTDFRDGNHKLTVKCTTAHGIDEMPFGYSEVDTSTKRYTGIVINGEEDGEVLINYDAEKDGKGEWATSAKFELDGLLIPGIVVNVDKSKLVDYVSPETTGVKNSFTIKTKLNGESGEYDGISTSIDGIFSMSVKKAVVCIDSPNISGDGSYCHCIEGYDLVMISNLSLSVLDNKSGGATGSEWAVDEKIDYMLNIKSVSIGCSFVQYQLSDLKAGDGSVNVILIDQPVITTDDPTTAEVAEGLNIGGTVTKYGRHVNERYEDYTDVTLSFSGNVNLETEDLRFNIRGESKGTDPEERAMQIYLAGFSLSFNGDLRIGQTYDRTAGTQVVSIDATSLLIKLSSVNDTASEKYNGIFIIKLRDEKVREKIGGFDSFNISVLASADFDSDNLFGMKVKITLNAGLSNLNLNSVSNGLTEDVSAEAIKNGNILIKNLVADIHPADDITDAVSPRMTASLKAEKIRVDADAINFPGAIVADKASVSVEGLCINVVCRLSVGSQPGFIIETLESLEPVKIKLTVEANMVSVEYQGVKVTVNSSVTEETGKDPVITPAKVELSADVKGLVYNRNSNVFNIYGIEKLDGSVVLDVSAGAVEITKDDSSELQVSNVSLNVKTIAKFSTDELAAEKNDFDFSIAVSGSFEDLLMEDMPFFISYAEIDSLKLDMKGNITSDKPAVTITLTANSASVDGNIENAVEASGASIAVKALRIEVSGTPIILPAAETIAAPIIVKTVYVGGNIVVEAEDFYTDLGEDGSIAMKDASVTVIIDAAAQAAAENTSIFDGFEANGSISIDVNAMLVDVQYDDKVLIITGNSSGEGEQKTETPAAFVIEFKVTKLNYSGKGQIFGMDSFSGSVSVSGSAEAVSICEYSGETLIDLFDAEDVKINKLEIGIEFPVEMEEAEDTPFIKVTVGLTGSFKDVSVKGMPFEIEDLGVNGLCITAAVSMIPFPVEGEPYGVSATIAVSELIVKGDIDIPGIIKATEVAIDIKTAEVNVQAKVTGFGKELSDVNIEIVYVSVDPKEPSSLASIEVTAKNIDVYDSGTAIVSLTDPHILLQIKDSYLMKMSIAEITENGLAGKISATLTVTAQKVIYKDTVAAEGVILFISGDVEFQYTEVGMICGFDIIDGKIGISLVASKIDLNNSAVGDVSVPNATVSNFYVFTVSELHFKQSESVSFEPSIVVSMTFEDLTVGEVVKNADAKIRDLKLSISIPVKKDAADASRLITVTLTANNIDIVGDIKVSDEVEAENANITLSNITIGIVGAIDQKSSVQNDVTASPEYSVDLRAVYVQGTVVIGVDEFYADLGEEGLVRLKDASVTLDIDIAVEDVGDGTSDVYKGVAYIGLKVKAMLIDVEYKGKALFIAGNSTGEGEQKVDTPATFGIELKVTKFNYSGKGQIGGIDSFKGEASIFDVSAQTVSLFEPGDKMPVHLFEAKEIKNGNLKIGIEFPVDVEEAEEIPFVNVSLGLSGSLKDVIIDGMPCDIKSIIVDGFSVSVSVSMTPFPVDGGPYGVDAKLAVNTIAVSGDVDIPGVVKASGAEINVTNVGAGVHMRVFGVGKEFSDVSVDVVYASVESALVSVSAKTLDVYLPSDDEAAGNDSEPTVISFTYARVFMLVDSSYIMKMVIKDVTDNGLAGDVNITLFASAGSAVCKDIVKAENIVIDIGLKAEFEYTGVGMLKGFDYVDGVFAVLVTADQFDLKNLPVAIGTEERSIPSVSVSKVNTLILLELRFDQQESAMIDSKVNVNAQFKDLCVGETVKNLSVSIDDLKIELSIPLKDGKFDAASVTSIIVSAEEFSVKADEISTPMFNVTGLDISSAGLICKAAISGFEYKGGKISFVLESFDFKGDLTIGVSSLDVIDTADASKYLIQIVGASVIIKGADISMITVSKYETTRTYNGMIEGKFTVSSGSIAYKGGMFGSRMLTVSSDITSTKFICQIIKDGSKRTVVIPGIDGNALITVSAESVMLNKSTAEPVNVFTVSDISAKIGMTLSMMLDAEKTELGAYLSFNELKFNDLTYIGVIDNMDADIEVLDVTMAVPIEKSKEGSVTPLLTETTVKIGVDKMTVSADTIAIPKVQNSELTIEAEYFAVSFTGMPEIRKGSVPMKNITAITAEGAISVSAGTLIIVNAKSTAETPVYDLSAVNFKVSVHNIDISVALKDKTQSTDAYVGKVKADLTVTGGIIIIKNGQLIMNGATVSASFAVDSFEYNRLYGSIGLLALKGNAEFTVIAKDIIGNAEVTNDEGSYLVPLFGAKDADIDLTLTVEYAPGISVEKYILTADITLTDLYLGETVKGVDADIKGLTVGFVLPNSGEPDKTYSVSWTSMDLTVPEFKYTVKGNELAMTNVKLTTGAVSFSTVGDMHVEISQSGLPKFIFDGTPVSIGLSMGSISASADRALYAKGAVDIQSLTLSADSILYQMDRDIVVGKLATVDVTVKTDDFKLSAQLISIGDIVSAKGYASELTIDATASGTSASMKTAEISGSHSVKCDEFSINTIGKELQDIPAFKFSFSKLNFSAKDVKVSFDDRLGSKIREWCVKADIADSYEDMMFDRIKVDKLDAKENIKIDAKISTTALGPIDIPICIQFNELTYTDSTYHADSLEIESDDTADIVAVKMINPTVTVSKFTLKNTCEISKIGAHNIKTIDASGDLKVKADSVTFPNEKYLSDLAFKKVNITVSGFTAKMAAADMGKLSYNVVSMTVTGNLASISKPTIKQPSMTFDADKLGFIYVLGTDKVDSMKADELSADVTVRYDGEDRTSEIVLIGLAVNFGTDGYVVNAASVTADCDLPLKTLSIAESDIIGELEASTVVANIPWDSKSPMDMTGDKIYVLSSTKITSAPNVEEIKVVLSGGFTYSGKDNRITAGSVTGYLKDVGEDKQDFSINTKGSDKPRMSFGDGTIVLEKGNATFKSGYIPLNLTVGKDMVLTADGLSADNIIFEKGAILSGVVSFDTSDNYSMTRSISYNGQMLVSMTGVSGPLCVDAGYVLLFDIGTLGGGKIVAKTGLEIPEWKSEYGTKYVRSSDHMSATYDTGTGAKFAFACVPLTYSFSYEGGEVTKVRYGDYVTIDKEGPAKTGLSFSGWSDGTGAVYKKGAKYLMPARDVTLVAQYVDVTPAKVIDGSGDSKSLTIETSKADSLSVGKSVIDEVGKNGSLTIKVTDAEMKMNKKTADGLKTEADRKSSDWSLMLSVQKVIDFNDPVKKGIVKDGQMFAIDLYSIDAGTKSSSKFDYTEGETFEVTLNVKVSGKIDDFKVDYLAEDNTVQSVGVLKYADKGNGTFDVTFECNHCSDYIVTAIYSDVPAPTETDNVLLVICICIVAVLALFVAVIARKN